MEQKKYGRKPKKLPDFQSEEEEKAFWETHDVMDYVNWDNASSFLDRVFKNRQSYESILKDLKKNQD